MAETKWTLPDRKTCGICGHPTNHDGLPHGDAVPEDSLDRVPVRGGAWDDRYLGGL